MSLHAERSTEGAQPAMRWNPNPAGPPRHAVRTGRLGLVQYGRVLAAITEQPRTHAEVAAMLGHQPQTVREILWRMQHMGEAHVIGWQQPQRLRGLLAAVFRAGPGPSAPYPRPLRRTEPGAALALRNPKPELMSFCAVLRALRAGCTRAELHQETGVAYMRLSLLVRSLRAAGLVHRCGWQVRDDGTGKPAEVFLLGPGRDVPRLPRVPAAQKQAKYLAKRRAGVAMQRMVQATAGRMAPTGGALGAPA